MLDLWCRNEDVTRLRGTWISRAQGDVLELGIGSGLNLPFYSIDVRRVYRVEPSIEMLDIARKRMRGDRAVEFLPQSAEEHLPVDENSIDTVVST